MPTATTPRRTDRITPRLRKAVEAFYGKFEAERLDVETPVYVLTFETGDKRVLKKQRCVVGSYRLLDRVATPRLVFDGGWVTQLFVETDHQREAHTAIRAIAKRHKLDLSTADFVPENCGWLDGRPVLFDW